MRDANANPLQQIVPSSIIRAVQRISERHGVRGAMALEYQTAQSQQGRTVVATVIHSIFKRS
jgi:hypothetical protein